MDSVVLLVTTSALLGSALVGGIFFTFSSFVMKALARVPAPEGISAMQSINVVVINRSFFGAFFGTALLCLAAAGLALTSLDRASSVFLVAGALLYIVGTLLVTVIGNVPLNDRLAAVAATETSARLVWQDYLERWTTWNHVRTAAAMAAALLFTLGLVQHVAS